MVSKRCAAWRLGVLTAVTAQRISDCHTNVMTGIQFDLDRLSFDSPPNTLAGQDEQRPVELLSKVHGRD